MENQPKERRSVRENPTAGHSSTGSKKNNRIQSSRFKNNQIDLDKTVVFIAFFSVLWFGLNLLLFLGSMLLAFYCFVSGLGTFIWTKLRFHYRLGFVLNLGMALGLLLGIGIVLV